jgi:hypothetical protein
MVTTMKKQMKMKGRTTTKNKTLPVQKLPRGWDDDKLRKGAANYKNQTEYEAVADDEAGFKKDDQTVMVVPTRLVPEIRRLLARRKGT